MLKNLFALLGTLLVAVPAGAAEPLQLGLPIACTPGTDCWVVHYVDVEPSPDARDFTCGKLTYDGHKGIDFAIRDLVAMQTGIGVVAAAPGIVKASRDGVVDREVAKESMADVEGRECGNGVLIDHGKGWTTQYCHLRQNSIQVRPGDHVEAGQNLGLVGLSGQTQFPHLHLTVRHQDQLVDPFTGLENPRECKGINKKPLWKAAIQPLLTYRPFVVYNMGFADQKVTAEAIRTGRYSGISLSKTSPAIIFWTDAFGIQPQDELTIRIHSPDGGILAQHIEKMDKFLIRRYQFVGKKKDEKLWPVGLYRGEVILVRKTDKGIEQFRADKNMEIH